MKIWILLLTMFFSFTVNAASPLPKDKVEQFFNSVVSGKISSGYDQLFIGSSIPKDKPQAVTMLKQQTESSLPIFGKVLGYEYVTEEKFGTSVVRYVYILKSEKGPTTWEFFFYRPRNDWFLANVIFNDQFTFLR
jgi:hypothetical protein